MPTTISSKVATLFVAMLCLRRSFFFNLSLGAVVLIGDSCVGKSNLLSRFTRDEFNLEVDPLPLEPRLHRFATSALVFASHSQK